MGRGLSPLQHQILRLAWEREQAPRAAHRKLFTQEIYVRLYHWPTTHKGYYWEREHGLAFRYARHFQPDVIGTRRYRATVAAVSRSLGRLVARGLLRRQRPYLCSWRLTAEGRRVVEALMVDKVDTRV